MTNTDPNEVNQTAFRQLKPTIDRTYPCDRFVAIDGGQIVADAATFDELDCALTNAGKDSSDVLVVQAGHVYPETMEILI